MSVLSTSSERALSPARRLYLLYHELRPEPSDYSYVVPCSRFTSHLDLIREVQLSPGNQTTPEVTFDDGHISNYEYGLPILQDHAVLAHFFITVGWTGQRTGYMNWQELRSLHQAGHHLGAHGWTHKLLTHCSPRELERELVHARLTLEDRLGTTITTMSLPGGRFNAQVVAACRLAGYTSLFTSVPKAEALPLSQLIGRLNMRGNITSTWILNLLVPDSKPLRSLERQYHLKEAAKNLLGDRIYARLWALLNGHKTEVLAEGA